MQLGNRARMTQPLAAGKTSYLHLCACPLSCASSEAHLAVQKPIQLHHKKWVLWVSCNTAFSSPPREGGSEITTWGITPLWPFCLPPSQTQVSCFSWLYPVLFSKQSVSNRTPSLSSFPGFLVLLLSQDIFLPGEALCYHMQVLAAQGTAASWALQLVALWWLAASHPQNKSVFSVMFLALYY